MALPKKKLPKANPQKKNRDTKPQYSKKNSSKHQGPWSARKSACMAPPGIVTQTNCNEWRELDEPAFESELDKICKGIEKFCGLEANQSSKQNSSQIVSNINEIPIECINASLIKGLQLSEVRGKKATDGTENFVKCDTPTSSMKNSQKPCLTNNLIRYTHIMMNMAVKCINTSEPQLQAKELLSVINHESRFIHNVNNPGGKGVMQLTSIAIKDVTLKKGASFSIWDEVKNNKECQAFNAPVQNIIDSMNSSKTYRACQVLNPKDGVKANIAIGLSLFKQYLTRTPLLLNKNIISFTSKKEKHAAQAKLTRLIYNRGEGPVAAALRTIKKRNDRTAKDIIEEVQWRMGEIAEEYGYNYSGDIERDKAILDNDYNSNYNNERQKLLNKLPKLKSKRVNSSSKVDQFIYKSISSSKLDKLIDKTRRYSGAILYSDSQDELNEISQAYRKSVKSYFKIDDSLVDSTIEKLQKFYSNTESLVIEEIEDKQGVLKCNRHIK